MSSYLSRLETELFKEGKGVLAVYGNLATGWLIKLVWPKETTDISQPHNHRVYTIFARGKSYEEAMKNAYEAYLNKEMQ